MAAIPLVAIETATGTTGSDGLAIFTFSADIDTTNHLLAVDRLPQGDSIDYTVTGARQVTFAAPSIPLAGAAVWLWNGTVAVSVSTSLPAWDTVAEVISDAAIDLGLISAPLANPFASTDANILQLISLLKRGGRMLVKRRAWTHLQNQFTFATVSGTSAYALPSDFRAMIDQTAWNRTSALQLGGPTSPQVWQYLQANSTALVYAEFRQQGGQIKITPTPTSVSTIAFEYISSFWIKPSGQTSPTSDLPSAATDVVCFDPALAVAMLKYEFRKAKKMDFTTEEEDFERALGLVAEDDSPAPILSLNGGGGYHLIDYRNLPEGKFG